MSEQLEEKTDIIPSKKSKVDIGQGDHEILQSFKNFEIDSILKENAESKLVCVHGRYSGRKEDAVVIMEKMPFNSDMVSGILSETSSTQSILQNDIYTTWYLFPKAEYNAIKATRIYPATEKHIAKYSDQDIFLIQESAEDYENITRPYLETERFSIQWVYNILEKKTEAERILYEDPDADTGFILLPDMKWDGKQTEDLYLVAITHKHGIKSIRELTPEHLPLLKNLLIKGQKAIFEKFSVPSSKLRVYLHYQPSYYHLHVHFTHVKYLAPGSGVEKAHLLSDVIENIELQKDYYQKKTLSFVLKSNDKLCHLYKDAGKI